MADEQAHRFERPSWLRFAAEGELLPVCCGAPAAIVQCRGLRAAMLGVFRPPGPRQAASVRLPASLRVTGCMASPAVSACCVLSMPAG